MPSFSIQLIVIRSVFVDRTLEFVAKFACSFLEKEKKEGENGEVEVDKQGCEDDRERLWRAGWRTFWSPALATSRGRCSAGTAIVAKSWLNMWQDREACGKEVVRGRAVHAFLRTRRAGVICLYSVYWQASTGWGPVNRALARSLGDHLLQHGRPVGVGGDFNMEAEEIEENLCAEDLGCRLSWAQGVPRPVPRVFLLVIFSWNSPGFPLRIAPAYLRRGDPRRRCQSGLDPRRRFPTQMPLQVLAVGNGINPTPTVSIAAG